MRGAKKHPKKRATNQMPSLDNPKHEAFALHLAKGMKQVEAYTHAGYSPNPSAASRLAASPIIVDRVDELKKEIREVMRTSVAYPSAENAESFREMGLTVEWVAEQYREIYEQSLSSGSFAAANAAVQNIQKMIENDKNAGGDDETTKVEPIKINDVTDMLVALKALSEVGQKEGKDDGDGLESMKDITPSQILATRGVSNDDDHQ